MSLKAITQEEKEELLRALAAQTAGIRQLTDILGTLELDVQTAREEESAILAQEREKGRYQ